MRQATEMEHHQAIFLPGKPELEKGLENVEYMEKDPMIFLVRHSMRTGYEFLRLRPQYERKFHKHQHYPEHFKGIGYVVAYWHQLSPEEQQFLRERNCAFGESDVRGHWMVGTYMHSQRRRMADLAHGYELPSLARYIDAHPQAQRFTGSDVEEWAGGNQ